MPGRGISRGRPVPMGFHRICDRSRSRRENWIDRRGNGHLFFGHSVFLSIYFGDSAAGLRSSADRRGLADASQGFASMISRNSFRHWQWSH